jgi:hypothetical protein
MSTEAELRKFANKEALKKNGVIDWNMSFLLLKLVGKKRIVIDASGMLIDGRKWWVDMSTLEFKIKGKSTGKISKN